MNYRQKFEGFLMQEAPHLGGCTTIGKKLMNTSSFEGIQKYVQNMYFEDPKGCVPIKYIGED
jgi:hypothetical protein